LTFDWEGINIDLLFARLSSNAVPSDFDVDNDAVLDGVDSATEKSLNGPRVTNLIASFVSGTPERYQSFLTVVRCVRKWAKARGLYSNKMGYWGGVNINIGVALTVQLYPNAPPAALLRKFFLVFKTWRWPQPLLLTKPHDAGYGLQVWGPHQSARQVAPMITPAYPAMNSTLSVSRQTLQIMQEEFTRAHQIVERLWKRHQQSHSPSDDLSLEWSTLFEPSDFFISYPVCVVWLVHSCPRARVTCHSSHVIHLSASHRSRCGLVNSVTFLSVLLDRRRRTLKRGLVLSSLDCESLFLICYPKVYRSKRFNCGRKR
jgi:poly(A) polymerase